MPHSIRKVIVSDALIRSEKGYQLHPVLSPWLKPLSRSRWQWYEAQPMLPLEWYAGAIGVQPTALIGSQLDKLPAGAVQCFIASPYHARMARDRIMVMPESMFSWSAEDGEQLCEQLNPLLAEDGLALAAAGTQMLLFSQRRLDLSSASFAAISGSQLPNRHPEGRDGPFMARLMTEIQMLINRNPMHGSDQRYPLHGLWFWGGCDLPIKSEVQKSKAVATRNPALRSLCEGRDASLIISEAELLCELLKPTGKVKQWLLAGENAALLATYRGYPWISHSSWQPKKILQSPSLSSLLETF